MTTQRTKSGREDRDLLIELRTKMEGVERAIGDLSQNMATRLSKVESEKLDRTEANRLQSEAMSVHADHETRIRFIERYMWGALAIVSALMFALNYFHPFTN